METEATPPGRNRPRPILLIVLGVALVAFALSRFMSSGSATQGRPTSNQPRPAATAASATPVDPRDLDVRLDALAVPRPERSGADRNPFRFEEPKPPPPPPPGPRSPADGEEIGTDVPPPQPMAPSVPPIPLKFIGIIEGQGKKLAALSDCKFTYRGEEGEVVDGRYRLVRIGVESVVMEHLDGRGRTTIRLSGDCPGR